MYRLQKPQAFRAIVASSLLAACTGSVADKERAPACSSPALRASYDAAYAWGEDGAGNMSVDEVEGATGTSPTQACALAGYREGLRSRHGHGHGHGHGSGHGHGHHGGGGGGGSDPDQQCKDDGTAFGEAAARVYCDLSISLGGLGVDDLLTPGPTSSCSTKYEEACQKAFDRVTGTFETVSGNPDAHCAPFTSGDFLEAYQVARFNQCLFSLAEPGEPGDAGVSMDGGAPETPCTGAECDCHEQAQCDLSCAGAGCELSCRHAESCNASCGDSCTTTCRDLETCDLHAQRDANLVCARSEQCKLDATGGTLSCSEAKSCDIQVQTSGEVSCTDSASCSVTCPDCDVTCSNVKDCRATLDKGSLHCAQVEHCELTCMTAGYHVKQSADGSYVCEKDCP
jgi:hypothetical protein